MGRYQRRLGAQYTGTPKSNPSPRCYQHVQALIVAIDQYAEAATGSRCYFLDRPASIGGSRRGDVP
jgi:hypothetical protein